MPDAPPPGDGGAADPSDPAPGRAPTPDPTLPPASPPGYPGPVGGPPPPPPGYPGAYPTPGYGPPGYGTPRYGAPRYGPPVSPFANYGTRLGAWLIDWAITSVIGAIALLPLHAVHRTHTIVINGSQSTRTLGFSVSPQGVLLSALVVIIYGTAFIGSARGQTLGMMTLRVRAVDAVSGGPIGHARALGRATFEYVLIFLLFIPWVLDMLFPLWDTRRQTLHDKVTNTVVLKI